jgi:hypothetical protein
MRARNVVTPLITYLLHLQLYYISCISTSFFLFYFLFFIFSSLSFVFLFLIFFPALYFLSYLSLSSFSFYFFYIFYLLLSPYYSEITKQPKTQKSQKTIKNTQRAIFKQRAQIIYPRNAIHLLPRSIVSFPPYILADLGYPSVRAYPPIGSTVSVRNSTFGYRYWST